MTIDTGPTAHTVAASTHGRYLVQHPADAPVGLLVGFHGYAENAEIHLAELQRAAGAASWTLVAVQALHRFYNRRGDVVASWMTSQDRNEAIADNIRYVSSIVRQVQDGTAGASRLVYVGFSQGTAMACRAAAYGGLTCDGVILLGGDVPPEIKAQSLRLPPALIGRGSRDDWYTSAKLDADVTYLTSRSCQVETVEFEGGHEWTEEFRAAVRRFLAARTDTRGTP